MIYSSLSYFEISNIEKVSEIITLSIAPAFSISALGIFASILYTFAEKTLVYFFYSLRIERLKSNKSTRTYTDFATEELNTSKEILKAIYTQTKTFESLNDFSTSLNSAAKGMEEFGDIAILLKETLNPEELGKIISQAVSKEMKIIGSEIKEITEKVNENSNEIKIFLKEDMQEKVILPLQKSVDSTDNSMKEMRRVLKITSDVMNQTSDGIKEISTNLTKLEKSQTNFVTNLDNVLDKQKTEFEKTTKTITATYNKLTESINHQAEQFNKNSVQITSEFNSISSKMEIFFNAYKKEYENMLSKQNEAIEKTSNKAIEALDSSTSMIENAGNEASKVIIDASKQMDNTLKGVDEALIKTSKSIQDELEKFRDSYTEKVSEFLGKQVDVLEVVIGKQTEKLENIVNSFKENLESDVTSRKELNKNLEELVEKTNGFVNQTKAMITTTFDEQQKQLIGFMENNKFMESKLTNMIDKANKINDNGIIKTEELIKSTLDLQKQFNVNQQEVLKTYQTEVDKHLETIMDGIAQVAGAMLEVIEEVHRTKND